MTTISIHDARLTRAEQRYLQALTARLQDPPRQPLPPEYERELASVYGACCGEEGDLDERGQ